MDKDYNMDDILEELRNRREHPPTQDKPDDATPTREEREAAAAAKNNVVLTTDVSEEDEPEAENEEYGTLPPVDGGNSAEEDGMLNIAALEDTGSLPPIEEQPEEAEEKKQKKQKAPLSKKKKNVMRGLIVLLCLLLVALVAAFGIANNMINDLVNNNKDNTVATTETMWTGMDTLEESFEPINEKEATELASLQDMIRDWYYNGTPCKSTHVLNVLLIGEDTRGKEILDEGTRADSAIIVSVNIDTKVITLTSILRDAWAYWETEKGNAETGQFGKINGAMSTGDINAYIRCLENLYKIQIDNYAIVNFDSFESIVDELGGVTLELTQAEINEINNHQSRYGHVTIEKAFEGNKGEQKLNGKQALAYCRIRKLDSDNMRADRQKTCLIQIFNQTKNASTVKLLKIIKTLIPYVKTSFGKSEIIKIAKYAFTQGWLDFDTYMQNMPEQNLKGGTYYGQWVWRPDYPADAYYLQSIIYGKSNITLARVRPDTAKCPERGFYSEGSSAMYTTITNNHYGEVTVVETTTKKDDAE